ncbi:MAG TPA: hypothetical protein VN922_12035 [Bacteroidia bacterium]|nr:hypothetical protein [Bacteroidia bacterium]
MAFHTREEFALKCGLSKSNLFNYITRGNVILNGELIDDTNEKNKSFLEKRKAKAKQVSNEKQTKVIEAAGQPPQIETDEATQNEVPLPNQTYSESERQLKYQDVLKRQKENEKLELEIKKKQGELIPVEMVKSIVVSLTENVKIAWTDATDDMIIHISAKYHLTREDAAELKIKQNSILNKAVDKYVDTTKKSLKRIQQEYSEKKNVGEHS